MRERKAGQSQHFGAHASKSKLCQHLLCFLCNSTTGLYYINLRFCRRLRSVREHEKEKDKDGKSQRGPVDSGHRALLYYSLFPREKVRIRLSEHSHLNHPFSGLPHSTPSVTSGAWLGLCRQTVHFCLKRYDQTFWLEGLEVMAQQVKSLLHRLRTSVRNLANQVKCVSWNSKLRMRNGPWR